MNVDDLLAYKPTRGTKRPREQSSKDTTATKKLSSDEATANTDTAMSELSNAQKLELLLQDDAEDEIAEVLDVTGVKKMLLNFEKKVFKNQELRIKHADAPEKFMESEVDLHEEIEKLHVLATVPELYPTLVDMNCLHTTIGLLNHENSDIVIAVVSLLQELTDIDQLEESEEGAESLMAALLEQQIVALLVQVLEKLDEKVREEAEGVHNVLAIVENMCEFKDDQVCQAAGSQGLLQWLLKRLKVRQFDPNKLYCSEILSILVQGNSGNQELVGSMDGIDTLLQCLAYYKRRDPSTPEELELMENLFNCLCSTLVCVANRVKFLKGEGLQLMILMMKEKKLLSKSSSLKVLDHAMCTTEGTDNCMKFVEVYGLRTLFPQFMKTPKTKKHGGLSEQEHEEHVCGIVASLFKNVQGPLRDRVINKFLEIDHEKVDRLIELHFKYLQRVREADDAFRRDNPMLEDDDIIDDVEDEKYLRRLDAGLYTLQLVDYIVMELHVCGLASIKSRLGTLLNRHGDSMKTVKTIMSEYVERLGTGDPVNNDIEKEKRRLTSLIDEL
ncbi:beta-catenin-like protein 1 [Dysidea avara]|uniref:beta-catenin-like protein 1 n=1 Tax=Dysidea avara TaxID=196820 RepID=UPI003331363E